MDHNFFGQSPAPQAFSPTPQQLAQAMQLPEFNNSTPQSTADSGKSSMPDMGMLAKMLQGQNSGVPPEVVAQGIPQNAMSYNTGAGPLPWLQQNQLPWLAGGS